MTYQVVCIFRTPLAGTLPVRTHSNRQLRPCSVSRLTNGDYQVLLDEPGDGVWIYADAPYLVNSYLEPTAQQYQFNFCVQDHYRLAEAVKNCRHQVMLSYDDDQDGLIRSLYPESEFWIEELGWPYCGTTQATKRLALLSC